MPFDEDKIAALREAAMHAIGADNEDIRRAVEQLCDIYDEQVGDLEDDLREARGEDYDSEAKVDAINAFCDVVQRPVGKLTFTVPQTDEANRTILRLHDVVGRNL